MKDESVVVGADDIYEEVVADVKSVVRFHIDPFGEQ